MKRYDYAEGCMEEMAEGQYVEYYDAEQWRQRAGRLTKNLIELGKEYRDLKEQLDKVQGLYKEYPHRN